MHHACIIVQRVLCRAKPSLRSIALPAEKLHALVALYHQSQSFIMPEKLDEAIDRAFVDVANVRMFG